MVRRIRIIQVPVNMIGKLCNEFSCSKTTVYDALRYHIDSELANAIRQKAMQQYGGVRTSKLVMG